MQLSRVAFKCRFFALEGLFLLALPFTSYADTFSLSSLLPADGYTLIGTPMPDHAEFLSASGTGATIEPVPVLVVGGLDLAQLEARPELRFPLGMRGWFPYFAVWVDPVLDEWYESKLDGSPADSVAIIKGESVIPELPSVLLVLTGLIYSMCNSRMIRSGTRMHMPNMRQTR